MLKAVTFSIGLSTKTSTVSYGEEIEAVHPIPGELFNIDQHIKLVQEWIYEDSNDALSIVISPYKTLFGS